MKGDFNDENLDEDLNSDYEDHYELDNKIKEEVKSLKDKKISCPLTWYNNDFTKF